MLRKRLENSKRYNTYGIITKIEESYKQGFVYLSVIYLDGLNIPKRIRKTLSKSDATNYKTEDFISLTVHKDTIEINSVIQQDDIPYEELDILDGFLSPNSNEIKKENTNSMSKKIERHKMRLLVCSHCGGPLKQDSFECPYCGYITE